MGDLDLGRERLGDLGVASRLEWLVTNGIGGFAAGTASGDLTRCEHGLLIAALPPPLGATLLFTKLSERLRLDGAWVDLDTNRWASGVVNPRGHVHLESFRLEGSIPTWTWAIGDTRLEKRVWMEHGENTTYVEYRLVSARSAVTLELRALASHRPASRIDPLRSPSPRVEPVAAGLKIECFPDAAPLWLTAPGAVIEVAQDWYRGFFLPLEQELGRTALEDHCWAGTLTFSLDPGEHATVVGSTSRAAGLDGRGDMALAAARLRHAARERGHLDAWRRAQPVARLAPGWVRRLALAAEAFVVERGTPLDPSGRGLVAGYPQPDEATRDALIALPGLTLSTGRFDVARTLLAGIARRVDRGLISVSPSAGHPDRFESVDVSLWLFQAMHSYVEATADDALLEQLYPTLEDIGAWLERGTRFGVGVDPRDALLRSGGDEAPLTWMDALVDGTPVTPRRGKPVEINALWYNALTAMALFARRLGRPEDAYQDMARRVANAFARYWNSEQDCLYDLLDGPEGPDASVRPNQLLAVSLPDSPLPAARRRAVLETCGRWLLTSRGLQSLAPNDPRHRGRTAGDSAARAASLHQGTVWGWLLPHYSLAHHRVHRDRAAALATLEPLGRSIETLAIGFLPEMADGDAPHAPRGRWASAAATGEVLRAYHVLAAARRQTRPRGKVERAAVAV